MTFYLLTELDERILTEDDANLLITEMAAVIPGPTVFYQGDGKKRKKRRYHTQELFDEIEASLRARIFGIAQAAQAATARPEDSRSQARFNFIKEFLSVVAALFALLAI